MCLKHKLTHLALAGAFALLCATQARAADPGQADLSVTKTAPAMATAGTTFTYNITLFNNTAFSNAANVSVTDTLPAGTVFISNTVPAGFMCTTPAPNTNGTVTCSA